MNTKLPKKKKEAQAQAFSAPAPRIAEPKLEVVKTKNLQRKPSGVAVPMQLKISAEIKRDFKRHAVDTDMTASNLFELVWDDYKSRNM